MAAGRLKATKSFDVLIKAVFLPVEAMACGRPVASTDRPSGPGEILGDGAFGPLVEVGMRMVSPPLYSRR